MVYQPTNITGGAPPCVSIPHQVLYPHWNVCLVHPRNPRSIGSARWLDHPVELREWQAVEKRGNEVDQKQTYPVGSSCSFLGSTTGV